MTEYKSEPIKISPKVAKAIKRYMETRRENIKELIEKYKNGELEVK